MLMDICLIFMVFFSVAKKQVKKSQASSKINDHSSKHNVRDAVNILRSLKTLDDVVAFTKGEKRIYITRTIPAMMNQLRFERAEKALHRGVVVAVPLAAHACRDAVLVEQIAEVSTGVLDATVRMVDQPCRRSASIDTHLQRVDCNGGVQGRRHRPPDDHA